MPVLEIVTLQLHNESKLDEAEQLQIMVNVRTALRERVHNTQSRFYRDVQDPRRIYIVGSWPTMAAHHDFLASPLKDEILALQGDAFGFGGMMHVDVDVGGGGKGIGERCFKAPVLAVEVGKGEGGGRVGDRDGEKGSWGVVAGLRCDGEAAEIGETVVFSGWGSEDELGMSMDLERTTKFVGKNME